MLTRAIILNLNIILFAIWDQLRKVKIILKVPRSLKRWVLGKIQQNYEWKSIERLGYYGYKYNALLYHDYEGV